VKIGYDFRLRWGADVMSEGKQFWGSSTGQRVMIGLAVLVLIPLVVWSISAFLRTYVSPPKIAAYRPAAIATPAPAPDAPEPMPKALSVRPIGTFPVVVASAGPLPATEPARVEPAAKDVRLDPVPLPRPRPRVISAAAARETVPLPRPRPRQPL
jgi:hypothetical protein